IARGVQGLVVDVGADRVLSAQQQRGDGQDARAAAEIQHALAGQLLAVQPLQAQRGGRVGAGAESQARVQLQVDRVRLRRRVPARHDTQALAESHRLEVVYLVAFPFFNIDLFQ